MINIIETEKIIKPELDKIDDIVFFNSKKVLYAFPAQKNFHVWEIFYTNVVVLTNKRILIARKRIFWGYYLVTITPDMFNDLTVRKGLVFGSILMDTVKEKVALSNIDPNALPEIETIVSEYMMEEKKKYINLDKE